MSINNRINQMARRAGLSRRGFLRMAAAGVGGATASSILAACGPTTTPTPERVEVPVEVTRIVEGTPVVETQIITATPEPVAAAGNELNLWSWSIYAPASAIESFQAQTESEVHVTYYFGNSELLAKIQAGGANADIIMPSQYRLNAYTAQGLIQPIDESKMPNFGNLYESVQNIDYMFYEGNRISVPYAFGVTAMVYNEDETGGPLDSWAAAWDPQYAGRIVMEDSESWVYAAAMALGFKLNELTEDTDAKLEAIKAKMIEQKPLLLKLYSGLEEMRTLLVSGDAIIAHTDDGLAWGLQKDGFTNIKVVVPQEGASGWQDQFCIPADAANPELAHAWINHMLDSQVAADFTKETGYLSVVETAAPLLPEDISAIVKHTDDELSRVQFTPPYPDEMWDKLAKLLEEAKAA
jgi:putative spermidine/putrescine transport system substrate-binding protein/spermidine/putrescine transport system substrate-binding protein